MTRKRLPAAQRRRQIAETALEIIAAEGVAALTAATLAGRVGVSDAALFRHFASMEAIVDAAIDAFEEALMSGFPPDHPEPLGRLRLFFVQRVSLCQQAPHILSLAFDNRLGDAAGPRGARRVRQVVKQSQAFIIDCIESAQRDGSVSEDISPMVLVWLVTGVVRGSVAQLKSQSKAQSKSRSKKPSPDLSPEALWRDVERLLLRSRLRSAGKALS
jgi:AcrR family transcriptional regulator